jgi:hypothetical protein
VSVTRAPRGSVVRLDGISVSVSAVERITALAAALKAAGADRAHRSGAVELLIMNPESARRLLESRRPRPAAGHVAEPFEELTYRLTRTDSR